MIRAFNIAATGMNAQQASVDNTANNLSNASTTGFKANILQFQDLIYNTPIAPGATFLQATGQNIPTGLQLGNGVRLAGNAKTFAEGPLQSTGNNLDLAITGQGFFQVLFTDGTVRYTRDGSFTLNANGQVVNQDGFPLQPAITIPQGTISITVGPDGAVSTVSATNPAASNTVGNIQLAIFPNQAGLSAEGRNLFNITPASGAAQLQTPGLNGAGLIQQGYLESSNVDVVQSLVNLIQAQRVYEFNTKAIRASDDMLTNTLDLLR